MNTKIIGAAVAFAMLCAPATAEDWFFTPEPLDEAFFGFAARVSQRLSPFAGFEDNYIIGGGYQRFLLGSPDFVRVGLEAGVAGRFGIVSSIEVWGGIVGRADFEILDLVRISPAFSFGLSAVSAPMAGGELTRQNQNVNGDATLLFYMGPEVSFSAIDHPETELLVRLHHRSGAWGVLGNMHNGLDSYALGVRHQF